VVLELPRAIDELERACAAFRAEPMARARSARHPPAALFAAHAGKLVLTRVQALYALPPLGVDSIEQSRHLHLGEARGVTYSSRQRSSS
jgi:hypothetical protein